MLDLIQTDDFLKEASKMEEELMASVEKADSSNSSEERLNQA